jgi:ABC-type spermidine/putrescine transport system permease subunit I
MRDRAYLLGLLPIGLFYFVFFLVPMTHFLETSLYPSIGPAQQGGSITARNYVAALSDPLLHRGIVNTFKLSLLTAVLATGLAYPIAYTVARSRVWGQPLFVIVVAVMFTSAVPRAMGWKSLLLSGGLVSMPHGLAAATIGTVHAALPLAVIGLLPVCEAIPRNLLEAARGLGASTWAIFWRIILPLTERGVVAVALLVFAVSAGAFTTPALLGGGRVSLLSILVRQELLQVLDYGRGTTYAVILLLLVSAVAVITSLVSARRRAGHTGMGQVPV